MPYDEAWDNATEEEIKSETTWNKGCPKAAFIGLCEEGFLKNITYTKESDGVNCEYAKVAINELQENEDISKKKLANLLLIMGN